MAEPLSLMLQAKDILATPSHKGLEIVINQSFLPPNTKESKTARDLYKFCVKKFPNCLALLLLKVYRCSSSEVVRFRSIHLLSETFKIRRLELSVVALNDIKPLLISCLEMRKTKDSDAKILQTIVSFVARNVPMLDNGGWDELSECILSVANSEPLRAFHVFLGLPRVNMEFIDRFLEKLLMEAQLVLSNLEEERADDWALALTTVVQIGIQVLNWELRSDLIANVRSIVLNSAAVLVEKRKKSILRLSLVDLEKFLAQDTKLSEYNKNQASFVSEVVEVMRKLSFKVICPSFLQSQENRLQFNTPWYEYLKTLDSINILKMVSSTHLSDLALEMAITQLNVLLSGHTSKTAPIEISVIRELQPLLISCLEKEEIPEKTFKILGEVVHHVAKEIFDIQEDTWMDLRNYITSYCQREFTRGCYIFTCLTMPLDDEDFVIPVMEKFLPEINTRLNPVDNSCWVLAFTGAFCAIVQLIEITSHAGFVEDTENKMINSVEKLVKSGMGAGLVRRAFIDMQSVVEEEVKWYGSSEFTLVKRLIGRLYTIQGMTMESKKVLDKIVETVYR